MNSEGSGTPRYWLSIAAFYRTFVSWSDRQLFVTSRVSSIPSFLPPVLDV